MSVGFIASFIHHIYHIYCILIYVTFTILHSIHAAIIIQSWKTTTPIVTTSKN